MCERQTLCVKSVDTIVKWKSNSEKTLLYETVVVCPHVTDVVINFEKSEKNTKAVLSSNELKQEELESANFFIELDVKSFSENNVPFVSEKLQNVFDNKFFANVQTKQTYLRIVTKNSKFISKKTHNIRLSFNVLFVKKINFSTLDRVLTKKVCICTIDKSVEFLLYSNQERSLVYETSVECRRLGNRVNVLSFEAQKNQDEIMAVITRLKNKSEKDGLITFHIEVDSESFSENNKPDFVENLQNAFDNESSIEIPRARSYVRIVAKGQGSGRFSVKLLFDVMIRQKRFYDFSHVKNIIEDSTSLRRGESQRIL